MSLHLQEAKGSTVYLQNNLELFSVEGLKISHFNDLGYYFVTKVHKTFTKT